MSESGSAPVFMFDNSDPEMQRAYGTARATFRYFWRESIRDRRRIIPALELACVKAPFSDGEWQADAGGPPNAEHMWLSEVDFDGRFVSGVLVNAPNWVKSVKRGDSARIPLGQISDWMYAISGEVFGGYTVNLLRSRMGASERRQHDAAWGLDFGDPLTPRMVAEQEHQLLSANLAASLREHLAKDPALASMKGHNGWTLLHQEASAGSAPTVSILLEAGADPNALTNSGMTPLDLVRTLGWDAVVELLERR